MPPRKKAAAKPAHGGILCSRPRVERYTVGAAHIVRCKECGYKEVTRDG